MPKRAVLIADRHALGELVRSLRLKPAHAFVLWTIMTLVDHRTHQWEGTLWELGVEANVRTASMRAVIDRLAAARLVAEVEPFGNHKHGILRLLAYDALIAPTLSGPSRRDLIESILAEEAQSDLANRATIDRDSSPNQAQVQRNRANDQPEQPSRKEQGNKEQATCAREQRDGVGGSGKTQRDLWLERPFTEEYDAMPEPPLTEDEGIRLLVGAFTTPDGVGPRAESA